MESLRKGLKKFGFILIPKTVLKLYRELAGRTAEDSSFPD
jgi:hypothetical protein